MTWKKRFVSLIVCFALVVSMTVVRPPKAEAIAFEAGIAVPIILAVAIASGITFLSEGMTESGLTEYIGQQLQQYATDIGTTVSEWWDGIGSISKRDNGQVVIGNPTYKAVQNFLSWWKGKNSVVTGSSFVLFSSSAVDFVTVDGIQLKFPVLDSSRMPSSGFNDVDFSGFSWFSSADVEIISSGAFLNSAGYGVSIRNSNRFACLGSSGHYQQTTILSDAQYTIAYSLAKSSFVPLQYRNGYYTYTFSTASGIVSLADFSSVVSDSSLSVSQPASYDALELQDDESVALDLGVTVEAGATLEDILAEYLAKIVDNTATAAQEVTTESGEGEGEGDDDDTAPYLPFIPRIWEKLQGLPDDIADKVHDLFVPSAAFVEALPAEFADVFDSRCGLLTYPAALLADFLTRLATLTAQEPLLRWGNINEPFSDRQLVAAGSYNLNSAIQTEAMQTVYNVYMICVKAAVAFWFVELCKRKYEKIMRS